MQRVLYLIPSCFFIGNLKGGGTIVSVLFCLTAYFLKANDLQMFFVFSISLFLTSLSIEKSFLFKGDDSRIVADELIGMVVSLLFLPRSILIYISALAVFRFFDISKPYLIKQSESIGGSTGIIMDDVLSGVASNIVIRIFLWMI
ncbi:MAG: phosphatidylglycerophosphatase A [bacterium]